MGAVKGREWDYCVIVTNDAESDATACADAVKAALTRIGAFLGWVASTAAQSSREVRWTMIWTHAFRKLLVTKPPDGGHPRQNARCHTAEGRRLMPSDREIPELDCGI